MKSIFVVLFALSCSMLAGCTSSKPGRFYHKKFSDLALEGYDPVAYQLKGAAIKGQPHLWVRWRELKWLFTTIEHKVLFETDPAKWVPQYGGYCAWAMARNDLAGTDPRVWDVVNGKLYLNYNRLIQNKWRVDQKSLILQADTYWQEKILSNQRE